MTGILFVYENIRFSDDRSTIFFDYRIDTDEQTFNLTETLTMPLPLPISATTDRVVRALHLALGISYYKAFIPPKIDHAYTMSEQEALFWNDIFQYGLGEFLYTNQLSADKLAKFTACSGTINPDKAENTTWIEEALLGIGGGKDSIVAGELLKELGIPTTGFVLATGNNKGQAQAVADVMGVSMLGVERRLDQQILEINSLPGAYNGHVPISLIFALVGCLLATITSNQYVIVANEASASIPQVEHNGELVNHQWSKSFTFEKQFQDFVHENISANLHYFSLIRPLSSVAVAKIFVNYPQYFEVFTSDNAHFKIGQEPNSSPRWGLQSAKSLSSYILLAPWMSDEDLDRTFGRNFLNEASLEPMFLDLLGQGNNPVLDCVGTPDELRLCVSLLAMQNRFTDTALMGTAITKKIILQDTSDGLRSYLRASTEHAIPEIIAVVIKPKLEEKLA